MKRLKLALRRFFRKKSSFSIGKMGEDRFAPVLKDGKETNCRIYLWDAEEVKKLQDIGDEIHRQLNKENNE